jgi:hypothetical protein
MQICNAKAPYEQEASSSSSRLKREEMIPIQSNQIQREESIA